MQAFRLNGSRVLEVDLQGDAVRAAHGAMIAYTGDVAFKNAGMGGGDGLRAALKRRATGESVSLMQCSGHGTVYFAKDAMEVLLVELLGRHAQGRVRAAARAVGPARTDVAFAGLRGASSGQGLFTTTVTGYGTVALLSSGGPPIALAGVAAVPAGGRPGRVHRQPGAAQPDVRHRRVLAQPRRGELR